jgi:probable F420-dependent oxidoreductase
VTIPPAELGRWAEDHGFESVWFGEHTHIPTSRKTPFPLGGELPEYYKQFFDPFIALTAAAAVTQKLKVGTSVCLVPEHHPITLAKTISCLDRVSHGRFLFGIGAGWNAEEMADHGVVFKDRWKVTRERVLAMQEIWTKEVAEFHGQFVNFDPLWCWPKPVQAGGPPVLIGAMSKWAIKRTAEYGDGWIPLDGGFDLARGLTELRAEAARVGRSMKEFDLSVITGYELAGVKGTETRIRELMELGFNRILFLIEPGAPERQWPALERYANLIRTFR